MKFIDTAWYVVFDGTSYYGLLGVDVEAEQDEDPDLSVEKGPLSEEQAQDWIDRLNDEAYRNEGY